MPESDEKQGTRSVAPDGKAQVEAALSGDASCIKATPRPEASKEQSVAGKEELKTKEKASEGGNAIEETKGEVTPEIQQPKKKSKFTCCGFGFAKKSQRNKHRETLFHKIKTS